MKYEEITGYNPHPAQLVIHQDKHRFKTLVCGRRFGKTIMSINELLIRGLKEPSRFPFWYAAPTYKQAKQIAWQLLKQYAKPPIRNPKYDNEVELSIRLCNGNTISLKGLDNPVSLEGVGLGYFVGDEISAARNWNDCWLGSIRPMLMDTGAGAMFISKPRGYNHFHTIAKRGDWNNIIEGDPIEPVTLDSEYITYRFTTLDNPYIKREEIEKFKQESTEEYYDQEILAKFTKYTGLVYKEFQREVHVIEPFDIPENWSIYRGLDFGSTNPTACLWIAVDGDDNWFVVSEHYATGATIDMHAGVINSNNLSHRNIVATYGDPSGAQWIQEFAQRGIYITPANKETGTNFNTWVRYGIEKVAERLKVIPGHGVPTVQERGQSSSTLGMPSLFVFRSCISTIKEFETYRWKEKSVTQAQDLNEPDVPEKANDHAMDALRYFAVSYKKSDQVDKQLFGENYENINANLNTKWRI